MSYTDAIGRVEQIRAYAAAAPAAAAPAAVTPAPGSAASVATADFARTLTAASASAAGTATTGATASATAPAGYATPGDTSRTTAADAALAGPDAPAGLAPLIVRAARDNGLDPALVSAVARAESGYRVDAGSPAGAQGLMQLMPSTAAGLGVTDILDPAQNLGAGARYLRQQLDRFGGDVRLALAAYNAGPGAVSRHGGIPPYEETQAYVARVTDYYDAIRGATAGAV